MVTISVLYPKTSESRFDYDYYLQKHMPMVLSRFGPMGVVNSTLLRGTSTLEGGTPPYELLGLLTFENIQQVQAALAAHGAEVIGDIPNFTNVQPVIQMNEAVFPVA